MTELRPAQADPGHPETVDLAPPPFSDGLADWSCGDGTPASTSYEEREGARIARGDPDFGACLELRLVDPVQRLRYMGELPLRGGRVVEVRARVKALRGPLPAARVAAWPGGQGGRGLPGLRGAAAATPLPGHGAVVEISATIGLAPGPGVDLAWDERAIYAHVGLDLIGPPGAILRIADIAVHERPAAAVEAAAPLPGFGAEPAAGPGREAPRP